MQQAPQSEPATHPHLEKEPTAARPFVGPRTAAVALLAALTLIAAAETLYGSLDAADDLAALRAGSGRLAAGAFLQLLAAFQLVIFLVGVGPLVRRTVVGRIGWWLLAVAVPCGGAFAMFHLMLIEVAAPGLDQGAMQAFLDERVHGSGPWGLPVAIFAIGGLTSALLLLVALARVRIVSVAAPIICGLSLIGDNVGNDVTELVALWLLVVAAAIAAVGLWRADQR